VLEGFDLPATTDPQDIPEIADVRRRLIELSRPLSRRLLIEELFRCRALMSRSAKADDQFDLTARLYADELKDYPADIVMDALRHVARADKWWPSWAELLEIVERRARPRRALMKALNELVRRTSASEAA
jgi:hypothetical protein